MNLPQPPQCPWFATYRYALLACLAAAAALLSIYAPLGIAPLLAGAGALMAIGAIAARQRLPLPGRQGLLLLVLLLTWGALSLIWAINPRGAVTTLAQTTGVLVCAAVLMSGTSMLGAQATRKLFRVVAIVLAAAMCLYAIELAFGAPIRSLTRITAPSGEELFSPYNRGLTVFLLLVAPTVISLRRNSQPRFAAALSLGAGAIIYLYYGGSLQTALTGGLFAALLAFLWRAQAVKALGLLTALMILLAPFVVHFTLMGDAIDRIAPRIGSLSAVHRLVIWEFATGKIEERPLAGWGLDAARAMPGGKEKRTIVFGRESGTYARDLEELPLHTHNLALQLWLELGVIGAALGAGFVAWLFLQIARAQGDRIETALLTGHATTALLIAGLSYGIWQAWWLSTLVLSAALCRLAMAAAPANADKP
jgi:O-antigen ligase